MTETQQVGMQSSANDNLATNNTTQQQQIPLQQIQQQTTTTSPQNTSRQSSPTNSISLIKLDELSSFGATKQSRLPALIKFTTNDEQQRQTNSMPAMNVDQIEQTPSCDPKQQQLAMSLPVGGGTSAEGKENLEATGGESMQVADISDDFLMVEEDSSCNVGAGLMGPSLPQPQPQQAQRDPQDSASLGNNNNNNINDGSSSVGHQTVVDASEAATAAAAAAASAAAHLLASSLQGQQQPSHLGDSLIDMIINLRNENQNLVRALETNNEYVKERLSEFKRIQEESKRQEAQFAMEKAEHEHQARKLQRQNSVLSDRLKSMEAKLKDMKLEISDSLAAAHSSKASSVREPSANQLYPQLGDEPDSFGNSALQQQQQATTIQMDATSGELYNDDIEESPSSSSSEEEESSDEEEDEEDAGIGATEPTAPPAGMDSTNFQAATGSAGSTQAKFVGSMSKEELGKRFDANKAEFYALDDPMKQCDKLEQQLNDIGKRDYEICLLQQQLNIYRQDYRLERMANLEAKIQIERLKGDIDRLCLDRLNETTRAGQRSSKHSSRGHRRFQLDSTPGAGAAVAAADAVLGKLGHQLNKRASKAAAKAAKHAAKQAHREEKAASKAAASAAKTAAYQQQQQQQQHQSAQQEATSQHQYRSHHHHKRAPHHLRGLRAVKSEVVTDLMSTANKAMLTGYKMASTHVNLALDKLSQFEQSQASQLAQNQRDSSNSKPMGPPSVD